LISTCTGSIRISLWPEVTIVNVEDSLMCKTCFTGPKNVFIECISSMLLTQKFTELQPYRM
jgi:hypothetical protein